MRSSIWVIVAAVLACTMLGRAGRARRSRSICCDWTIRALRSGGGALFVATDGGPLDSTLFYVLYLFRQAFQYFNMGYASALAWILFLIILVLTLLIVRSSDRWVFYEGERR